MAVSVKVGATIEAGVPKVLFQTRLAVNPQQDQFFVSFRQSSTKRGAGRSGVPTSRRLFISSVKFQSAGTQGSLFVIITRTRAVTSPHKASTRANGITRPRGLRAVPEYCGNSRASMPMASVSTPRYALHLDEVVKRVGSIQVACMNEAHEQITHSGAVQRLVEERVLAMQNGFLQSTLDDVVIDWSAWFPEEKRQFQPVI